MPPSSGLPPAWRPTSRSRTGIQSLRHRIPARRLPLWRQEPGTGVLRLSRRGSAVRGLRALSRLADRLAHPRQLPALQPRLQLLSYQSVWIKGSRPGFEIPANFIYASPLSRSRISEVIFSWRPLLYSSVSSASRRSAFSEAVCIAMVRAACSAAAESSTAAWNFMVRR